MAFDKKTHQVYSHITLM